MTIYRGFRYQEAGALVVTKDGKPLSPAPSQKLFNHSPDGFQWGYGGSGPAQLALALLLDATNNPELSVRLHQTFKRHFVAAWGEQWQILDADILTWIEEFQPCPVCGTTMAPRDDKYDCPKCQTWYYQISFKNKRRGGAHGNRDQAGDPEKHGHQGADRQAPPV